MILLWHLSTDTESDCSRYQELNDETWPALMGIFFDF